MLQAFDTEYHSDGSRKLVCVQIASNHSVSLFNAQDGTDEIEFSLTYDTLVGHFVASDLAVLCKFRPSLLPLVFEALEKGRIRCTEIREKLLNIKDGTLKVDEDEDGNPVQVHYGLSDLSTKYLRTKLDKSGDSWRLRYGELDGVPVGEWPYDAKKYAWMDATTTLGVYLAQETRAGGVVVNEIEQIRASFVLHYMSLRGMITDGEYVEDLKEKLQKDYLSLQEQLGNLGFIRLPRPLKSGPNKGLLTDPSTDTKAVKEAVRAAYEALGVEIPLTDTGILLSEGKKKVNGKFLRVKKLSHSECVSAGYISTSRDTLLAAGIKGLREYAEYKGVEKTLKTYIPVLERGVNGSIHCKYNVLVGTGRTSCYDPNLQNIPRDGGVRDAFIPRPGFVFAICDYSAIELRALAQICLWLFGHSSFAEAFKEGRDPHLEVAADRLGISYQEALGIQASGDEGIGEERRKGKAVNFGIPGGLGAKALVEYARKTYGVLFSLAEAKQKIEAWKALRFEMEDYFEWVNHHAKKGVVKQFVSGRVRGGLTFCQVANTGFQGLAADGIKHALWDLFKVVSLDPQSPLFGSHLVTQIHDEIILEVPIHCAAEAAEELSSIMRRCMAEFIPDIPIETSLCLAPFWAKNAKEVRDEFGQLIVWMPKDEKGKQRAKLLLGRKQAWDFEAGDGDAADEARA